MPDEQGDHEGPRMTPTRRTQTDKPYEPEEDPDTGPARTPREVEAKTERDQAEGDAPIDGPA